jgi:rod shape-determining protein MreC
MGQSVSGSKRVWLVAAGLAVLIGVLVIPDWQRRPAAVVERPVAGLFGGVQRALASTSSWIRGVWSGYLALVDLRREHQRLQDDLDRTVRERDALREVIAENRRLTALLAFQAMTTRPSHGARVIGRDPSRWYQSLTIDRGSRSGAAADQGVELPTGIVGTVIKVFPTASVVLLISDTHSAVPVLVQRTREQGIVEGTFGGRLRLKYLPPSSDIRAGDVIVTSGLTDPFPKGLMVGTVNRVERPEGDLYPDVGVIPSVDLSTLEEVLVIERLPAP